MTRKTTVGLLLFVVSASVVGVQLADPFHSPGPDRFGSIDPSAPPEEVAAAALAQRGTTSHTARASYNETITNATMVTSRVEGTQTLRVDPDDHQALARTPNDDRVFWNQYYT